MLKLCVFAVLTAVLWGCAVPATAWKGEVEWPDEHSAQLVAPPMEAGAALAAAAAVREMVRTNKDPRLFRGCSSPEQGLDVVVFTGPTKGLYYVVLHQRFHRCGGPSGRVLDWWYEYAVTAQGEVVAEAPPMAGDYATPRHSNTPPPEETPPPAAPSPERDADGPSSTPLPVEPSPTSSLPAPPVPGTPEPASPVEK